MLKKIWKGIKTGIKGIKKGLVKAFGEKGAMLVGALAMWFIAPQIASWFGKSGVATSGTVQTTTATQSTNIANQAKQFAKAGKNVNIKDLADIVNTSQKAVKTSITNAGTAGELVSAGATKVGGVGVDLTAFAKDPSALLEITGGGMDAITLGQAGSTMTSAEASSILSNYSSMLGEVGGTGSIGTKVTELGTRAGFMNKTGYYALKGVEKAGAFLGKVYTTPSQAVQGTFEALGAGNLANGMNTAANVGREWMGLETSMFKPTTIAGAKDLGFRMGTPTLGTPGKLINPPKVLSQSLLSPSAGTPLAKAWGGMKEIAEFGTAAGTIHTAFAGRPDLYMPGADSTQGAMYLSNTVDVTSRRSIGDPTTKQNFDNALTVALNRSEIPTGIKDNILQSSNRALTYGKAPLYGGPRMYDSYMQAANQWTS